MQSQQATALTLSAVIERARATRKRAAELNMRSGDTTFPEQSKEDLLAWVRGQLKGARRASEVADLSALLLPAPNATLEARVLAEYPDTIEVLGVARPVEYRAGFAPRVTLDVEVWESRAWLGLPDEELRLPGGKSVEIEIRFSVYYDARLSAGTGRELKALARAKVDESVWSAWPKAGRPTMMRPDPADPAAGVPEIVEVCYGTSTIDGTPLMAFGVLEVVNYWSTDQFREQWFQKRTEAEEARANAIAALENLRVKAIEDAQIAAARSRAEASKAALEALERREDWEAAASSDLQNRVSGRRWMYIPSDGLQALQVFAETNEALLAEAERSFAAKAENDVKVAAAEAAGMLLRKLEVVCYTRYGVGRVWVVRADGTLREHDERGTAAPSSKYTAYVWYNISDELVLVESVTNVYGMPNRELESGGTGVLWRPAAVTREQIAATEAIENEHGLAGTFEVSPELVAQRELVIAELHREITRLSPLENVEGVRFIDVSKGDGWNLSAWWNHDATARRLNNQIGYMEKSDPVKVLRAVRCAGGVLEFLAFKKYGATQINAKWRPLTEEEKSSPSTIVDSEPPAITRGYGPLQVRPVVEVVPTVEPAAVAVSTTFTHAGNRDFRCSCGCSTRVEKSQMARILAGEVLTLRCTVCGKSGEARKS